MSAYQEFKSSLVIYAIGVLGSFLIVIGLIWAMYRYTRPEPITQDRANERKKALTETRMAEADALNNYGWVEQARGLVRLPIARAMQITLREYEKSPSAFRSNIVTAAEKASAPISYE